MKMEKKADLIVDWIREKVKVAKATGAVVGLSGGIDSCVVAVLCKRAFPDSTLGVIMPCESDPTDEKYAKLLAKQYNIPYCTVDLTSTYETLLASIIEVEPSQADRLTKANIKPRLRMTTLYYFAGLKNSLVIGTGNKTEIEIGYYTKYGDGGVDIEPIGHLLKVEVRELARYLGIPDELVDRPPTAGLWENQTDEDELGITYEEIDSYLNTGEGRDTTKERVTGLQRKSEHKRNMPPIPKL